MNGMRVFLATVAAACVLVPSVANAQSMDVIGARAAGLAGAFVGVADDASAAYWNPAGLAAGAYFSLVLDAGAERAVPGQSLRGRRQSSFLLAAAMPALSVTYYRLQHTFVAPYDLLVPVAGAMPPAVTGSLPVRVDSLVTHHAGVTLVQSILQNVAIGTTLKVVRGLAASEAAGFVTAEQALEDTDLRAEATSRFDLDFGAMATLRSLKLGLTVRNVREPQFDIPGGDRTLRLKRQARAGVSFAATPAWLLAADVDLLEAEDAFGDRRDLAVGVEGRLARRLTVRSGLRLNVAEDRASDTGRAFALGGSFAATAAIFLDGAAILGGDTGGRGWRVGARFVY